jgi:predicted Zn-dependent protease
LPYAEKSIQLNASLVEGHDLLGDIRSRRGEYDRALASFQRTKAIDPMDLEALRGIGQTLVWLKRYEDAVTELNEAIAVYPEEPEFYYDLSQAYLRLGDRESAAQALAKFRQLHAAQLARQNAENQRRAARENGAAAKQ